MYDCKCIGKILQNARPQASASIAGSEKCRDLKGTVAFYDLSCGVLVTVSLANLPFKDGHCQYSVLGLHIHEGMACTGDSDDPFADTKGHYNPGNCPHPMHAGDLPPVFVNDGLAWHAVITNRFTVKEIIGRTVVVHGMVDDFHSQPSGDSGEKIACGIIIPRKWDRTAR